MLFEHILCSLLTIAVAYEGRFSPKNSLGRRFTTKMFFELKENQNHKKPTDCSTLNGEELYQYTVCPTSVSDGESKQWLCIRYTDLCNGYESCPHGEDEHPIMCMIHNEMKKIIEEKIQDFLPQLELSSTL